MKKTLKNGQEIDLKDILSQEEKERVKQLHWDEGTLFEEEYYYTLAMNNPQLKEVLDEAYEEIDKEFGGVYTKDVPLEEDFIYCEADLARMQLLDTWLEIGLYD